MLKGNFSDIINKGRTLCTTINMNIWTRTATLTVILLIVMAKRLRKLFGIYGNNLDMKSTRMRTYIIYRSHEMSVTEIKRLHDTGKNSYDAGGCPEDRLCATVVAAIKQLGSANSRTLASIGQKSYSVFEAGSRLSRPYLPSLYFADSNDFSAAWRSMIDSIDGEAHHVGIPASDVNKVVYTAITAFSVCYDLWNPGARKTPGTFFEVLIGSIIGLLLPTHVRSKFIPIPDENESVSTDIVFEAQRQKGGLVFPTKITTRDRVVQPFAHQRILDSVFGADKYKSLLLCVSELQRAGDDNANEICVPGTIRLFQRHLANLAGIYYLDPPTRYLQSDVTDVVTVDTLGTFLTQTLPLTTSG